MLQKGAIIPAQSNTKHFLILVFGMAEDTFSHYDLAGRKWNSWCSRRQINPITCPLNFLSDFLTQCYHEDFHFNTISGFRSAIFTYHDPIGGISIGSNTCISHLLSGMFNNKSLQPEHTFIWDVKRASDFLTIQRQVGKANRQIQ